MTHFALQAERLVRPMVPTSTDKPFRVLHALAVSLPHLNGYTVRSRYILRCQRVAGWAEPVAITSPFYPGNPAAIEEHVLDGIRYHRVPHPSDLGWRLGPMDLLCRLFYRIRKAPRVHGIRRRLVRLRADDGEGQADLDNRKRGATLGRRAVKVLARRLLRVGTVSRVIDHSERWLERLEEFFLVRRFTRSIQRLARSWGAEIVHAHSPYRTGLPAIRAARRLGLPVVYEVRGLWEESAVTSGRFRRDDERYRRWREKETETMRRADAVITISEALREEVISRGVPRDVVSVVPNAVDPERFKPLPEAGSDTASDWSRQAGDLGKRLRGTVLGYVGSVRSMEGVDELIRGAAELIRLGRDVSVLIVGGGPDLGELATLAKDLGIPDRVLLPGRVPHETISWYYRLIDVFVISRPDFPVTRTVTPLKPLEAMAMCKPLIVSDLPALREMVQMGETGLFYRPGDPEDLARQALRLIDDREVRERMGRAARQWVEEHRTWERALESLPEAYRVALDRHQSARAAGA